MPWTHQFSLQDADTWRNPPLAGHVVVWTFPAEPLEWVMRFHRSSLQQARGLIVLASTSAYRLARTEAGGVESVDEDSPLDGAQARVAGEAWLLEQGATILQLAGIFGPGREPEAWLRAGRIRDGAKIVNLIHVDDIVSVIAHLLEHPLPGQRINLANGHPVAWRELAATMIEQGRLPADFALASSRCDEYGKRVDTRRLQALLPGHRFRRP